VKKFLLIQFILVLFLVCTDEEGPTLIDAVDLVPTDNEISGWVRDGDMEIAQNETELFAIINGEGADYVDHDFVKFVRQFFQGNISANPVNLELRIADMGDTSNAKGVYDAVEYYFNNPISWTAGTEARYELIPGFPIASWRLDFWEDRFFMRIEIYDGTDPALNIAQLFAMNISQAIQATNINPEN
jgi:hypothetical protein